jgi:hypothetical protein
MLHHFQPCRGAREEAPAIHMFTRMGLSAQVESGTCCILVHRHHAVDMVIFLNIVRIVVLDIRSEVGTMAANVSYNHASWKKLL